MNTKIDGWQPVGLNEQEGRKENSLIPGSQLGCMDGIASVCHQHDILSRQAMMYLLTMGWFLAHSSLAMTPEHSATNGETLNGQAHWTRS